MLCAAGRLLPSYSLGLPPFNTGFIQGLSFKKLGVAVDTINLFLTPRKTSGQYFQPLSYQLQTFKRENALRPK